MLQAWSGREPEGCIPSRRLLTQQDAAWPRWRTLREAEVGSRRLTGEGSEGLRGGEWPEITPCSARIRLPVSSPASEHGSWEIL
jgi:hypothetical protein